MATDVGFTDSPATLVAILVAAHRVGDRDLERAIRDRLQTEYGVKLVFTRGLWREREANDDH